MTLARAEIEAVFRAEHGKVFAGLVRFLRDFELADDALQEAFVKALERWPEDGVPERPAAWITTVARNAATSKRRHDALAARKGAELAADLVHTTTSLEDDAIPDERLRLVFACCHPALAVEARIALTLSTLAGLDVEAIGRLLVAEPTAIAQRLVRAKRKIAEAGIPLELPRAEDIDERLAGVLSVVYLLFTEGYDPTTGDDVVRPALCEEAIRLGRVLVHLMPQDPEVRGLTALMCLHHARVRARGSGGRIVPLEEQDRAAWDQVAIADAAREVDEALARGAPGPYQIQAAIAALHATAPSWEATDFVEIAALYRELWKRAPAPSVALGLALAEGVAHGADVGLRLLDELAPPDPRTAAARAELLRRAGRPLEAASSYREAMSGARHAREQAFFERRLEECARGQR